MVTRGVGRFAALAALCLVSGVANAKAVDARRPLTVTDAIQSVRALENGAATSEAERFVFVSPDRSRYAVFLIRGDLHANGIWGELLTARLGSLEAAAQLKPVTKLFTQGYGARYWYGSAALTQSAFNPLSWLDDHTVALLWESPEAPHTNQVVAIDVDSGAIRYLTNGPTQVTRFDVAPEGSLLIWSQPEHDEGAAARAMHEGFTVTAPDIVNVLHGDVDGHGMFDRYWNVEKSLVGPDGNSRQIVADDSHAGQRAPAGLVSFSPNRRTALIDWTPRDIPAEWSQYDHAPLQLKLREARVDPLSAEHGARGIWQLFVVDLASARARPMWNAPMWSAPHIAWHADGRHAVIGPTFLPVASPGSAGHEGAAVAVVDIDTGAFQELQMPSDAGPVLSVQWPASDSIVVRAGGRTFNFRRARDAWRACVSGCQLAVAKRDSGIRVELRQGLNQPPVFFARDIRTGRERQVLDLNAGLEARLKLGRVESLRWQDEEGRDWSGLFFYPAEFVKGTRYPLVIQTHGVGRREDFTLYGPAGAGLGPGHSVFAAQALANRGIAVVQIEDKDLPGVILTPDEPRVHMQGYESAIRHLVRRGIVDEHKVGLVGFSRTGWHVGYALSHSQAHFAAAIVSDNYDGNYMQATTSWNEENTVNIGAPPFGAGLQQWLSMSPAFNVEHISTPLRLQVESGGVVAILSQWEMFQRLRQLGRPVELKVLPEVERGSHGLQNPLQCLAAQQGAVNWFDFWLNDRVDPSVTEEDAQSWRAMRDASAAPPRS